MAFDYDFTEKLKGIIRKLREKDQRRVDIIYKKVNQIINCGEAEVEHYKNLRYGLSNEKRVHIDKSFVLIFRYDKIKKSILFVDFDHHDNIYKK